MKISDVQANNRMKCFLIETKGKVWEFPYSELSVPPSSKDSIAEVWSDPEIGHQGFSYRLRSGKEDTVLLEQVLEYNEDTDYLRQQLLYKLSLDAQRSLKRRKISKRELARRMKTQPAQLYRLLDATFYGKTIDQMVRLLHALGHSIDIVLKDAA